MTPTELIYEVYQLLGHCLITPPLAKAKALIEDELGLNLGDDYPDNVLKGLLRDEKKLFGLPRRKQLDAVVDFSRKIAEADRSVQVNPMLSKAMKRSFSANIEKLKIRIAHDILGIDISKMKRRRIHADRPSKS